MKSFLCATLGALLLCAGCATQREATLSAVGPQPGAGVAYVDKTTAGTLVVYSAWRRTGTDDPDHRIHSNYDVLMADGKPILQVRNYITPMLEDPASVQLAPGKYAVKARVQGYGYVTVPVVIESRKLTALYMDDSTRPERRESAEKVQLPDGRVIGWASSK
jgi:hypothetical protein